MSARLTAVAEGDEPFALCATTVSGFVRIVTHPRIFATPSPPAVAIAFIEAITESPRCRWLEPAERWWSKFAEVCQASRARGRPRFGPDPGRPCDQDPDEDGSACRIRVCSFD